MTTATSPIIAGPLRRGIAALLAALYLLIAVGPLPSLALPSHQHPHAGQTACSGDCRRDGCSLQSRLNQSCCCWKKKQQENRPLPPTVNTADCCHAPLPSEAVRAVLEETVATRQAELPAPQPAETALSCGCPCDGSDQSALLSGQGDESLLCSHRLAIVPPEESPYPLYPGSALQSLCSKPLLPPPKPV